MRQERVALISWSTYSLSSVNTTQPPFWSHISSKEELKSATQGQNIEFPKITTIVTEMFTLVDELI